LVHSRLDYGNSVLVGLPAYLLRQLQSVLNAAARLVYHLRARDNITDAIISLRSTGRVQHVSDLRPKFALRQHHVWNYGRHPISDR